MENRLKQTILLMLLAVVCSKITIAQTENSSIATGNQFYKEGQFEKAMQAYQQALDINPANAIAKYNLAAAKYRLQKFDEAQKDYASTAENTDDKNIKGKSVYNEGVALSKQKKLLESIASYKKALQMNPADVDTRFNLQKALEELRKQQKSKEPEKKKDQPQKENQKKKDQDPPPANKKQIEQWLQSLKQKEQEVQQKMQQQKRRSTAQPDKDW